jgi:predicted ATP-grasp superfamily ATP-dependent carboligase
MAAPRRVLVTGADQHQGLAVIRGLGHAGYTVIAAGSERRSLGFASRHAAETRVYRSPFAAPGGCQDDLLAIIEDTRPELVLPSVEATLVLLSEVRGAIPPRTLLAAPAPQVLEYALDKGRTLELAQRIGVPAPRTARGSDLATLLAEAAEFRFPLAVKPRGHALHATTANALGFKARYAGSFHELRRMLEPFAADEGALLVQEFVPGVGRCVAAVCDQGRPLALFAYARDREVPVSGGVSVVRRSIPMDATLHRFTTDLLGELRWHGVAMVEYKFDPATGRYTLMEINGRFQASTALSLDAGLNLPHLVAALFLGDPLPTFAPYRVGVEERWLRGDIAALAGVWRGTAATPLPGHPPVSRLTATWRFLRDFRPGMCYDEFKWGDWRPGLVELRDLLGLAVGWFVDRLAALWRRVTAPDSVSRAASTPTHRSIRA